MTFTILSPYSLGTDKLECERYWTIDDPTRRYGVRSGQTKSDNYQQVQFARIRPAIVYM